MTEPHPEPERINVLTYRDLGIDTHQEHIAFMKEDCPVCLSEGFESLTRLRIHNGSGTSIVATLNVVTSDLLENDELGLSERARQTLGVEEGDTLTVSHLEPLKSLSYVRRKIYGKKLFEGEFRHIIEDITEGRYSNAHIGAFLTAVTGNLDTEEIIFLTRSMIQSGRTISWEADRIADKHSIGGLPGNRTTPILVSIVAARGEIIPKTSSRAITSPAGTADVMDVMTRVDLTNEEIREVVEKENGCIVWGGTASISPADDIIVRVERALDIDSGEQMIASILSKKAAIGSTHVVIDVPVGNTAKVRSEEEAEQLEKRMVDVGKEIGLSLDVLVSDGRQPVGRGIGPALEAMDVLSVLRNERNAPEDLRERSLALAGSLLELTENTEPGDGYDTAREVLDSGRALEKFRAICRAQGKFREPEEAEHAVDITASRSGTVTDIDNRLLARTAKLAGAPGDRKAGIRFFAPIGTSVREGDRLFTLYAESKGELQYAREFYRSSETIIDID